MNSSVGNSCYVSLQSLQNKPLFVNFVSLHFGEFYRAYSSNSKRVQAPVGVRIAKRMNGFVGNHSGQSGNQSVSIVALQ